MKDSGTPITGSVSERRKAGRVHLHENVLAHLLLDREIPCLVKDISYGGLSVVSDVDLPLDSYFSAKILPSDRIPLTIDVRVVWKNSDNSHNPPLKKIGLALMQRKDVVEFQRFCDHFPYLPSLDRREAERRMGATSQTGSSDLTDGHREDYILEDKRRFDRRDVPSVTSRTFRDTTGLDRWISYYSYGRINGPSLNDGKIMLGSNNYLGLSRHPKVMEAGIKAIERYGVGAGGSRVLSGTFDLHKELEVRLAHFKGSEASLVFPTGYMANYAALTSLVRKGDILLNDQFNHASIIDGCRATSGVVRFYRHNDMKNLETKLNRYHRDDPKIIITDGVFSMDGDIVDLKELHKLARLHNATVMLDEAHATGVIGNTGRGTSEYCGLLGKIDITVVTFSKAFGGMGGAICGSRALIKYINHHSRQFIFSTSIAPSICASVIAAIDVLETEPEWLTKLNRNRKILYQGLKNMGYIILQTETPIIPVIIGDEKKTYALTHKLNEMGVFVNAVSRPSVPRELSRIRVTAMATHSENQLSNALDAFQKAGKSLGLI